MTARHPNIRSCHWDGIGVETRWLESVRQRSVLAHLFPVVGSPRFLVLAGSLDRNRSEVVAPRETRMSAAPDRPLDDSFSRGLWEGNCGEPLGEKNGVCELLAGAPREATDYEIRLSM